MKMESIGRLVLPLIMTLITECIVAAITGVRVKRQFVIIVLMNVLTNPLINTALRLLNLSGTLYFLTVSILEGVVVFTEGFILKKTCTDLPMNPYILSFILNLSSFMAGVIWAVMLYLYIYKPFPIL